MRDTSNEPRSPVVVTEVCAVPNAVGRYEFTVTGDGWWRCGSAATPEQAEAEAAREAGVWL